MLRASCELLGLAGDAEEREFGDAAQVCVAGDSFAHAAYGLPNLYKLDKTGSITAVRSITSPGAKATLGELIASLETDGPVDITRNGRKVAVLSAPEGRERPVAANRVAVLASLYAAGKITWREISAETGVAYGELLAELARQHLLLPRVTPAKRPEQVALLDAIFRRAAQR